MTLDIGAARSARPYSMREYAGRIAWALATPLFRFTPKPLFGWRNFMLRCFGARIGRNVRIHPSVRVVIPWNLEVGDDASLGDDVLVYNLGPIIIGARASVSHRAHLCGGSHDHEDPRLPLLRLPIRIGDDAWICAQAFVGPDVVVGNGAVVAACAVAVRAVEDWTIVAGNPARPIKTRSVHGGPTA
ncbi:putative colanic acid biosynthesis acetyltransferase [Cognatilysobacter lacus]|uniref:Putative colanic acid biosynthesis acetyltransferase n=1 Tax=Cognatilysobacter lacus TaxID=1643323 RepID=A0A5D8Z967_9GAMM|nr:putative colanic acid biosynthesis acetyltransferase [Lysobacter lacus]TZF91197.1 putative colanic acid biosynthesis acetyltransferase [Lysobacter lacus]